MVNVINIDIGEMGIQFPRAEVGIVIAQPFVELVPHEPFSIHPEKVAAATAVINATFDVALRCAHGLEKTHFTVFPEYSLPGVAGFDHVKAAMANARWPTGTVVIGGLAGITRNEFIELIGRPETVYDNTGNSLDSIRPDQWVNCCVTWVKVPSGQIRAWIQIKIEPAFAELQVANQSMFRGNSIFLFKGTYANTNAPYQFATLICYDWIGLRGENYIWAWLLQSINEEAGTIHALLPLTWLFVTQFNPEPSHPSFMRQVLQFFDPIAFPNVLRENTCLIMANVAGNPTPGVTTRFGRSAVIFASPKFSKMDNPPTYCNGGEVQRPGNQLVNFKDAVFRERGACIHSFRQLNPIALPPGAAGKKFALADATVHAFSTSIDPRSAGGLVPAVVKWVNDELDDDGKSLAVIYSQYPLVRTVAAAHQRSIEDLRLLAPPGLSNMIRIASPGTSSIPDQWMDAQSKALKHVLNTYSILEAANYPATFHGNGTQATITVSGVEVEVVAVASSSHEETDRHVLSELPQHRGQLLLISRDEDNTSWNPRMRTIFDQAVEPTKELNFTDPTSAVIRVGYHDFLKAYQNAADQSALKEAIDAAIS